MVLTVLNYVFAFGWGIYCSAKCKNTVTALALALLGGFLLGVIRVIIEGQL